MLITISLTIISVILFYLAEAIFNGNTRIIRKIYKLKVTSKESYVKSLSMAFFILSFTFLVGALFTLVSEDLLILLVLLTLGIVISIIKLFLVQKRFTRNNNID